MTIEPIVPDAAPAGPLPGSGFLRAVAGADAAFASAARSEAAFAGGSGSLLAMTLDRAQADIVLSVAAAACSRCASALGTVLNMQV
jgi:hypothetical protein